MREGEGKKERKLKRAEGDTNLSVNERLRKESALDLSDCEDDLEAGDEGAEHLVDAGDQRGELLHLVLLTKTPRGGLGDGAVEAVLTVPGEREEELRLDEAGGRDDTEELKRRRRG